MSYPLWSPEPNTWDATLEYTPGAVVAHGTALHLCTAYVGGHAPAPAPAEDPAHWRPLAAQPAGVPVLYGPYVVDYTDIPHDGDKLTLWTPQSGDVLLRLFPDDHNLVEWDHGSLCIGQNLDDGSTFPPLNCLAFAFHGAIHGAGGFSLDNVGSALDGLATDGTGTNWYITARVFRSTNPVQIMLSRFQPGASDDTTDPTQGHVELYAVIARAVAP